MLTIGEVARETGLKTSALRYYETAGLVPRPKRLYGQRRYDSSVLDRLAVIQFARHSGFSIREIRILVTQANGSHSAGIQKLAQRKIEEMDVLIRRAETIQIMLRSLLQCQCLDIEECGQRIRARLKTKERSKSIQAGLAGD